MSTRTTYDLIGRLFALAAAASCCGGCSLLFHADAEQCASSTDCLARGPAFANSTCQAGTCVLSDSDSATHPMEGGADSGKSGKPDASMEAGADAEAGTQCSSYTDCPPSLDLAHPEVACDIDTRSCVQLTTDECPFALGDYKDAIGVHPIFFGAFATIPSTAPTSHPSYMNYALAVGEFTAAGGIPIGPSGGLRMPVAVVCNDSADVSTIMPHLVNDVHVSSLIAALDAVTLKTTFTAYGYNTHSNLFMVNPFGADSTLTALNRGEQLWNMLGVPSDVAPAYAAAMPRLEQYVRNNSPWNLGPTTPMRVAVVTGSAQVLDDLASSVLSTISWNNGETPATASSSTYDAQAISISSLNGTDPSTYDYTQIISDLIAFQPNVIISFGSEEFIYLLERLEVEWTGGPLPFYLVGPYNAESTNLVTWIGSDSPAAESRRTRVVGVNYASSTDTSVLVPYEMRFSEAGNPPADDGEENYYDAVYFLVDSMIGTGKAPPLTGGDVGTGMLNLIAPSGAQYDMGPMDISSVSDALSLTTAAIGLDGTLGPPYFNTATGARISQGDIYCMQRNPGLVSTFDYDVLRLTSNTDGGAPYLGGTFPCYSGF